MKDFYQYIYNEVKNNRLGRTDAVDLIRQFQTRIDSNQSCFLHPFCIEILPIFRSSGSVPPLPVKSFSLKIMW